QPQMRRWEGPLRPDLRPRSARSRLIAAQRPLPHSSSAFWHFLRPSRRLNRHEKRISIVRSCAYMSEPVKASNAREVEERFRLLVENVRDYAIFMLDPEGRVATWNKGAERLKGYRADEIIGQHFSKFYPAEDLAAKKPETELEIALAQGRVE